MDKRLMDKRIKATIIYTVDSGHVDFKCGLEENHVYVFTDTYTFSPEWYDLKDVKGLESHCKQDLLLVAAGGYDYEGKHVHNVAYKFEELN